MSKPKKLPRSQRAYKNVEFLNSPDARSLRILSEFLEPLRRFRQTGVRDTIVFFGSARIKPRSVALAQMRSIKRRMKRSKRMTSIMQKDLDRAESDLEMSRYYEDAVELSRLLTQWSKKLYDQHRFVVCSGGGPGIMEAANKGAYIAKGKSIGLNISLPFEQYPNRYISAKFNFEFHYFFMRKFWFAYLGKAFVMFPGGFGTLDEMMEVLTLLQTTKIKKKVTLVLYGSEYWKKMIDFDSMVRLGMISKADMNLFVHLNTPKEAFQYLTKELQKNYPRETRPSVAPI